MARILIVEDEPLIAMLLADWLVELGHDALGPALSVRQALELIDETMPGAVILDVNLQDQQTQTVADALAARSIPFAVATGSHAHSILVGHRNAPAITKPYDFAAVERVVDLLLRANHDVQDRAI